MFADIVMTENNQSKNKTTEQTLTEHKVSIKRCTYDRY